MFVQAHGCAVFPIKKSNICVSKLMCVLFLCARQWSRIKEAEKDYEEEAGNEEEDSYFDVKAPSVMLCKIALFGCQRSIFLLYKVQRRNFPKFKSNDAQFFLSHICSISTLFIEESLFCITMTIF